MSLGLVFPGKTYMQMILSSLLTPKTSVSCRKALNMERSHGEEGVEGKCRKDKGHNLWYRPGPLAEFRQIPMRCLSYRSRQQQHLLQWLQNF